MDEATRWRDRFGRLIDVPWVWLPGLTLLAVACVVGLRAVAPWEKITPDYICYWAAGKLVASGQSPYDEVLQTRIQQERGWDRVKDGLGHYDFLPYYYPPWFAAGCALLVPLGYDGAKAAWFFLNLELLLLSGYLLRDAVPGVPRSVPPVLVPLFALSVVALFVGQTSILMLFLIALAWKLLARGNDRLAGAALAGLTTKPQLTAFVVLAVLIWAARRRRWGVVTGFAAALAALSVFGALIVVDWPLEMLRRPGGRRRRRPISPGSAPPGCWCSRPPACGPGRSGGSTWPSPCRSSPCCCGPRSTRPGRWKTSSRWA